MRKKIDFILLGVLTIFTHCNQSEIIGNPEHKIVIQGEVSPDFQAKIARGPSPQKAMRIQYVPLHHFERTGKVKILQEKVRNGKVTWVIYSGDDLLLTPQFGRTFIVHPGDSIYINFNNDKIILSENEKTDGRMAFVSDLIRLDIEKPLPSSQRIYNIKSLIEFQQWNNYLDEKLNIEMSLVEKYKNKLSAIEHDYYKQQLISTAESVRVEAFGQLLNIKQKDTTAQLSYSDLNAIWDSTHYKIWAIWVRSLPAYLGSISDIHTFNRLEVCRKFNFNFANDSLKNKETRTYLYYTNARDKYKGVMRERLMAFILDEQTITEMGLKNPMTQILLKDYYNQPGYHEYKQMVRQWEEEEKVKEAQRVK